MISRPGTPAPVSPARRRGLFFWMYLVFGGLSVAIIVLIGLVVSFGIPALGIEGSYQEMERDAVERFSLLADERKELLQFWLLAREGDLSLLAEGPEAKREIAAICLAARSGARENDLMAMPAFSRMEARLKTAVRNYSSVAAMHLIDIASGVIVASSSRQYLGQHPENEAEFRSFAGSRHEKAIWFFAGKEDQSGHLELARRVDRPDDGDRPVAVLVSHVSIEEILLPMLHTGGGLGMSGEIVLVGNDQRILTPLKHPLPDGTAARVGEYRIESAAALLSSMGKEGALFAADYRGVPVLASFRHVNVAGEFGWGMIVKQDESEIRGPAWRRLATTAWVGAFGLLVVLVGSWVFATYLTAPLRLLTGAASSLSEGDFSQRVPQTKAYREAVELSSAFNIMAERLRGWDATLNREIALKTRQLTDELAGRNQVEQALRESERALSVIFQSARDGILVADAETHRFVLSNGTMNQMLGYPADEITGLSVADIHPAEELARVVGVFERQLRGEFSLAEGLPVKRKDGSVFFADVNSSLLELRGRPHLLGIFRDISGRMQAEAERERLMAAVEQAGEAVILTDDKGVIEYVNPAFEAVSGFGSGEAVGRTPRILKSGKQDDEFYRDLWSTISGGRSWQGRITNKRKDGTLYTEDATISPVFEPSGKIVNYVAVKRDVTERIQAAEDKARLEAQFQQAQKMESIGRLAGGVAHDFNNMLGIILGYGDLILNRLPAGDPLREPLSEIMKAGQRSAALTRQLLAFSRKQVLQPEVLDLNTIVSNLGKMLCRILGEDTELKLSLAGNLARVRADAGQIEQVIVNLAVNSRDAMPQGGRLVIETANVDLGEADVQDRPGVRPGKYVMLAVTDTGCGMSGETLSNIFEPFFTTKERGKGTGLGLATAYGIIKQSNGDIRVDSEPGRGSTFKIFLPQTASGPDVDAGPSEVQQPAVDGLRILVAEDEAALRGLLERMLSGIGYQEVALAASGEEALLLFESSGEKPDLVIADVVMPGMSGKELVERLRTTRPDLKFIFMSGYTDETIVHHGIDGSTTPFLQKPFSQSELAAKIREICEP